MKKNIKTIIYYGTIKKNLLGLYFIIIWIIVTYVTLPSLELTMKNFQFSFILFIVLFILFLIRVAVDYNKSRKLTPNPNSTDQVRVAHNYLRKLDENNSKVYEENQRNHKYQVYKKAYSLLNDYYEELLQNSENYNYEK